jgi:ribosomal protein L40E
VSFGASDCLDEWSPINNRLEPRSRNESLIHVTCLWYSNFRHHILHRLIMARLEPNRGSSVNHSLFTSEYPCVASCSRCVLYRLALSLFPMVMSWFVFSFHCMSFDGIDSQPKTSWFEALCVISIESVLAQLAAWHSILSKMRICLHCDPLNSLPGFSCRWKCYVRKRTRHWDQMHKHSSAVSFPFDRHSMRQRWWMR